VYWLQKEEIKRMKGRKYLRDYRDEHKVTYRLLEKYYRTAEILENDKDPVILWVRRYIKESGF
jgi:hypothetical protein